MRTDYITAEERVPQPWYRGAFKNSAWVIGLAVMLFSILIIMSN